MLARVLWAHMRRHGLGYMPAGLGHGATSPTATRAAASGKVPKIPVLVVENFGNAMLPVLAGARFVSYITGGVIRGLREWVVGGHGIFYVSADDLASHGVACVVGLLVPPRLLEEVDSVRG